METQLLKQIRENYQQLLADHDLAAAMPLIRQAANWGDLESQILAKNIFLHGLYNHPVTDTAALEYGIMAALNEDVESMYDIAWLYTNGHGCVHDQKKALYWISKAANLKYPPAMDVYGMLFLQGRVVLRNPKEAKRWFDQANSIDPQDKYLKHLNMALKMIEKQKASS